MATPRFNLDTYNQGEEAWSHTDTVEKLDELAIQKGLIADRPNTGDYDDELYYATDQDVLWGWDNAAGNWVIRGGTGSASQPLDSVHSQSVNTDSLVIGGTLYEEDANSPFTFSGQSSATYSVDGTYDELIIVPFSTDSSGGTDQLQVNGNTGADYRYVTTADSQTTGANQFNTPEAYEIDYIKLHDRIGRLQYGSVFASQDTGVGYRGVNLNISGPITQFTLIRQNGSNVDVSARVYGRELE